MRWILLLKDRDAHTMPPPPFIFFEEETEEPRPRSSSPYLRGVDMIVYVKEERHYGFFSFLGDCIMTVITGGLWLIWVFVREMRKR